MTTTTQPVADAEEFGGSKIIEALERAWSAIRANVPDLPEVVIITGSGAAGGEWGHTWAERWAPAPIGTDLEGRGDDPEPSDRRTELSISGERLACGARLTFQTLLHEAAHAVAHARGIKDTSRQGRYHNRRFVAVCEELGLEWPADKAPDPTIGFSAVVLQEETGTKYAEEIDYLATAIRLYLPLPWYMKAAVPGAGTSGSGNDDGDQSPTLPPTIPRRPRGGTAGTATKSRNLLAECQCDTPRKLRISRSTLDAGAINCGLCGSPFELKDDEEGADA
jgi:hypothetical protein